jgi:hypothetical protein
MPSPSIIPDNGEYAVIPTILFESTIGPSDEKFLGPTNSLIRACYSVAVHMVYFSFKIISRLIKSRIFVPFIR